MGLSLGSEDSIIEVAKCGLRSFWEMLAHPQCHFMVKDRRYVVFLFGSFLSESTCRTWVVRRCDTQSGSIAVLCLNREHKSPFQRNPQQQD